VKINIETVIMNKSTENTPLKTSDGKEITPWRCFSGAIVSGGIGFLCYLMTSAIAQTFANKPITSTKVATLNIAAAVRTLVLGISTLGTCVFAIAALGLVALGLQLAWQKMRNSGAN
jgi:hypothetical protein